MAQVPEQQLRELAALDGYDRTLAFDRIGRQHNIPADVVAQQLQAFLHGGAGPVAPVQDEVRAPEAPVMGRAQQIEDAHRYRVRYDPSDEARTRQSAVEQAIVCPNCHAPLGIPAHRPIKVTCPNCGGEAIFTS